MKTTQSLGIPPSRLAMRILDHVHSFPIHIRARTIILGVFVCVCVRCVCVCVCVQFSVVNVIEIFLYAYIIKAKTEYSLYTYQKINEILTFKMDNFHRCLVVFICIASTSLILGLI